MSISPRRLNGDLQCVRRVRKIHNGGEVLAHVDPSIRPGMPSRDEIPRAAISGFMPRPYAVAVNAARQFNTLCAPTNLLETLVLKSLPMIVKWISRGGMIDIHGPNIGIFVQSVV